MKTNTIFLILLATVFAVQAEEVITIETKHVAGSIEAPYFFPSYSVDGKTMIFTQEAYKGLWIMDRKSNQLKQITDSQGAGYLPISLSDGSIIFRQDTYLRGRKYTSLLKSQQQDISLFLEETRFLSPGALQADNIAILAAGKSIFKNVLTGTLTKNTGNPPRLINDQLSLKVLHNNTIETLAPLGEGNYIWGSISSSYDKIVFTKAGQGTYISDLDGKHLIELGEAHTPQWSPDGRFIVYMKDLDDGNQYIASEIWIVTSDGTQSWMITDTPSRIEMYPQWSPDGRHIAYHTPSGEVFETTLQITD